MAKTVCKSFLVRVPGKAKRKRVTFKVKVCIRPVTSRKGK